MKQNYNRKLNEEWNIKDPFKSKKSVENLKRNNSNKQSYIKNILDYIENNDNSIVSAEYGDGRYMDELHTN